MSEGRAEREPLGAVAGNVNGAAISVAFTMENSTGGGGPQKIENRITV